MRKVALAILAVFLLLGTIAGGAFVYLNNIKPTLDNQQASGSNNPNPAPISNPNTNPAVPTVEYVILKEGKLIKHLSDNTYQTIPGLKGKVADYDYSSQSQKIAYTVSHDFGQWIGGPTELYLYDLNTDTQQRLVGMESGQKLRCKVIALQGCELYEIVMRPTFSPNGQSLAFSYNQTTYVYKIAEKSFLHQDDLQHKFKYSDGKGFQNFGSSSTSIYWQDMQHLRAEYAYEGVYDMWFEVGRNSLNEWKLYKDNTYSSDLNNLNNKHQIADPNTFKEVFYSGNFYHFPDWGSKHTLVFNTVWAGKEQSDPKKNGGVVSMNYQPGLLYDHNMDKQEHNLVFNNNKAEFLVILRTGSEFYRYQPATKNLALMKFDSKTGALSKVNEIRLGKLIKLQYLDSLSVLADRDQLVVSTDKQKFLLEIKGQDYQYYEITHGSWGSYPTNISEKNVLINTRSMRTSSTDNKYVFSKYFTKFVIDRQTGEVKKIG